MASMRSGAAHVHPDEHEDQHAEEHEPAPRAPSPPPDRDPSSDRTREHTKYKISQDNHAMARRRILHGDDVDRGFYGGVNPNPGFNNDPPETQLMNLREARNHAVNEINGRNAFNQTYYGGNHQGINDQVALRTNQVQQYDKQIDRLQDSINNRRPDPEDENDPNAGHDLAGHQQSNSQGPPGWLNEQENDHDGYPYDGNHEQDHEPLIIGQGVQYPGQDSHGLGEGEEGEENEYGEGDEADQGHYDYNGEDDDDLYG